MQLVRVWPGKNRGVIAMTLSVISFVDGVYVTDVLVPAHHNRAFEVKRGWRRFSFKWSEEHQKFVDTANGLEGGYLLFRTGESYLELDRTGEPSDAARIIGS
jgi:hypothetical protein